jgi:hypothetical protein
MQPLNIQNVIEEVTRRVIALRDSHLEEVLTVTTESNDSEITRIDDKVISTHQLRDLPPGIPAIQVTRKSLITPAAADWLREQNVQVLRVDVKEIGADANVDSGQSTWTRVSIVSSASGGTTDGAETFDCIVKAAGRCVEAIDDGDRVILVTDLPSLALITLNRNQNVRAIGVGQATELRKDAGVTFANLFVVDPQSLQFTRIINQIQLVPLNTGAAPKWL